MSWFARGCLPHAFDFLLLLLLLPTRVRGGSTGEMGPGVWAAPAPCRASVSPGIVVVPHPRACPWGRGTQEEQQHRQQAECLLKTHFFFLFLATFIIFLP